MQLLIRIKKGGSFDCFQTVATLQFFSFCNNHVSCHFSRSYRFKLSTAGGSVGKAPAHFAECKFKTGELQCFLAIMLFHSHSTMKPSFPNTRARPFAAFSAIPSKRSSAPWSSRSAPIACFAKNACIFVFLRYRRARPTKAAKEDDERLHDGRSPALRSAPGSGLPCPCLARIWKQFRFLLPAAPTPATASRWTGIRTGRFCETSRWKTAAAKERHAIAGATDPRSLLPERACRCGQ